TSVTRGSGVAVVTQTGMRTELGRITELVAEAVEERTPLEVRLDALGRKLIWVTLGIAALVSGAGILRGKDLFLMIETGIALAVASIPEGLPIVATIALARGVRIMARRNALINRLSSVETLGAAGVICTDKTGTLTENRMTVVRLAVAGKDVRLDEEEGFETEIAGDLTSAVRSALEVGALCNNATRAEDGETSGDPLEVALHAAAAGFGIKQGDLLTDCERVDEEAFDADVKMMATVHRCGDRYRYAVKGAPEAVLEACGYEQTDEAASPLDESRRAAWEEKNEALAAGGLRVLALAEKYSDSREDAPYEGLVMLGLVGMADPPRSDVRPSIERCKSAGIQVVMVTGDQPVTALGIGREVGLVDEGEDLVVRGNELPAMDSATDEQKARLLRVPIFARVTPAQKLDLIALHQGGGHVVAMTGDGVNDAPALQKADIGIAMGRRGTQVAREAADMVLQDDAFSTIVAAVEQGRIIFGNIRRFVLYLLSCNVSEVMVVAAATLVGGPLPLLPLQILFLNLVTDIFPALALGVGA
ncbi:MAG: HAD-IC family P-type ATPase, partial [Rhodothermales bacterium]